MTRTAQNIWILLVILLMAATSSFVQAAWADPKIQEDPQSMVTETIDKLINRLQNDADRIKSDQSIAYQISNELVAPLIDFPRVTRLVIGKHWRKASETQRNQLIEEIRSLLIRSYVTAMTNYTEQIVAQRDQISYLPSRYKPGDKKASVGARITLENGQSVEVHYQLYYRETWKIYDIRIEGISLAITYRTSFGEQIGREGLNSLITQLAERNRNGEVELPPSKITKPFKETPAIH